MKILILVLIALPLAGLAQTKDTFTVVNMSIKNVDTAFSTIQHKGGGLFHVEVAAKKIKLIPPGTKIVVTMPEYYKGWFAIYDGRRYNFIRKEVRRK